MNITLRDVRDGEQDLVFAIVKIVLHGYGLEVNPDATDKDLSNIKASYIDRGGCFDTSSHYTPSHERLSKRLS